MKICVFFYKFKHIFLDLADKVFKFRVIILLLSNLMLNYSTYMIISLLRVLKKPAKIFSFLLQNPAFRYSGIFCEMHVLLLLVYLDIVILRK